MFSIVQTEGKSIPEKENITQTVFRIAHMGSHGLHSAQNLGRVPTPGPALLGKRHPSTLSPMPLSPQTTTPELSSFKRTQEGSTCVQYIFCSLFSLRAANNHKYFMETFRKSCVSLLKKTIFFTPSQ